MYIVYDKHNKAPMKDRYGHIKVYSNMQSALRKAREFNNSTYPKIDRMKAVEIRLTYY